MRNLKFTALITCIALQVSQLHAQQSKYIIQLKDKLGSQHTLSNPSTYLSPFSIERKKKYNILIDSADLPVSQKYIDSIQASGKLKVLNASKWLNQVLIQTTDAEALKK